LSESQSIVGEGIFYGILRKDFYTSYMQLTINLILDAQRIIMIVSVVYLVLFFALGSGLFNSIIEGASRGTKTFIVPTRSI
jgi:hypothetical protein